MDYRIVVRHAITEENRVFDIPERAPELMSYIIEQVTALERSRVIEAGMFRGTLESAMTGSVTGYVGPFLEIRKVEA